MRDALDQQAAVSEVLAAIGRAGSDPQPVFDLALAHAGRLCHANGGVLWLRDGDLFRIRAGWSPSSESLKAFMDHLRQHPVPLDNQGVTGRAYRTGAAAQIPDVTVEPGYNQEPLRYLGAATTPRTLLGVPLLLKDGTVIGALSLAHHTVKPFTGHDIAVVQTFADQAVLALENARLFNETKEALERQTAISDILRVISSSPTDVQPVLDTIAESAARFCSADDAGVALVGGDGRVRLTGTRGRVPQTARDVPLGRRSVTALCLENARLYNIADMEALSDDDFADGKSYAREMGFRAVLAAPLLKDGRAIGCIQLRRNALGEFSSGQVELVQTFADQAVIAIENVRLFNETKDALAQQTAVGDVLGSISRSVFDLDTVLRTVLDRARELCAAEHAMVVRRGGEELALIGYSGGSPAISDEQLPHSYYLGPGDADAIATKHTVHLTNLDPLTFPEPTFTRKTGSRCRLVVPLVRSDDVLGLLILARGRPEGFTDRQMALVETFADQAVIAMENVRLFNEIQEKSAQLEAASRHKSEFMANMSHELRTPLNAIIGFSDVLEQRLFGALNERQADYTRDIASSGRHLLELVNEILDLSKVEAGRMELDRSEFALADTIRAALAFVRERAASHRIEVDAMLPEDLGTVVADERKIRQVLLNLLSNAVKFTPDGGRVTVRAVRVEDEIQIAVQDTGIGIAPEDQPRVFEEFRQVGKTSDRSREGTGLGLTLAKRFIELHGGRIWIDSEVGKGTTFTFALPLGRTAIPN